MTVGYFGVSTLGLNNSLRYLTMDKQVQLNDLQKELASGRHADLGRELGIFSSSVISLEQQVEFIDQTQLTNGLHANRLSTMQQSMASMVDTANNFIGQVATEMSAKLDPQLLKTLAESSFGTLHSVINVTFKGDYLFSGINTDVPALNNYSGTDGAPAKAAVQASFVAEFGFSPSDPAAASITPAQFESYIDGAYADLFNDANWDALWSGASDRGLRAKISTLHVVETPATANATAFRELTAATVMAIEFADGNFADGVIDKLAEMATKQTAESIAHIGDQQSIVGVLEERIKESNETMTFQKNVLQNELGGLTQVDPYEAAISLSQLTTSLEASYSTTARIQGLSLLNFI